MITRKVIIFIGLFLLFGCNVNKKHPIPHVSFDTSIDFTLPSYSDLQGIGGWAYVPVAELGSKGVVVYRQSQYYFVAFDRRSPAPGSLDCGEGLQVDVDNFLILNDPCSDARYSLYDGSVVSGDSKFGLRAYETEYNGANKLRIYNP